MIPSRVATPGPCLAAVPSITLLRPPRLLQVGRLGRPRRDPRQERRTARRADFENETLTRLEQLGRGQIEARLGLWTGLHRHAEAGACRRRRN